ncbi:MAG: hypothetical protein VX153_05130 [Verrucomicrobiota bacterium]|nr:hypothetical protein [Verrucomicrobiota bacterium]
MTLRCLFIGILFSVILIGADFATGQAKVSQTVDRDEYFRRLEQRALSLSKKFADLSGTEPVQLFVPREPKPYTPPSPPPKTFNYSPQGSYDALPGPSPLIPATTVSSQQNPTSSTSQQFVDDEVIDYQPTMEERRGEYILRPFVGIQLPKDQKYNLSVFSELDSYVGYSLGLHAAKRIEDFTAGLRFGYSYHEMAAREGVYRIDAENELLSFTGTLGYSAIMTDKLSFDFGFGLGFGNRFNSSIATVGFSPSIPDKSSEKTVFIYEFSLLLDYAYSENLHAFGGYRLVGASDNGPFGRMVSHLFEIGVGANF